MTRQQLFIIVAILFIIGLFLRTYRLGELVNFGYDQGRDAFKILRMVEGRRPVFIGPEIGGLQGAFLGPFFYYFLLPFYWLGDWYPKLPALAVAFLSALSIPVIYFLGKNLFRSVKVGLLAVFFLTFSYGAISYSRWLSNPSPYIFLSTVFIFSLIKAEINRTGGRWLIIAGLSLGLALQTELANASILPLMGIVWLVLFKPKVKWKYWILAFLMFGLVLSPLIIFDLRHNNLISKAIFRVIEDSRSHTSLADVWGKRPSFYLSFLKWQFLPKAGNLSMVFLFILFGSAAWKALSGFRCLQKNKSIVFISIWFLAPFIIGMFYTANYGQMFDYYFLGQLVPGFLVLAYLLSQLKNKYRLPFNFLISKQTLLAVFLTIFSVYSFNEWRYSVDVKKIDFGINKKMEAIRNVYRSAQNENYSVFIFTPNGQTEAFDYLFWWLGRKLDRPVPGTVAENNEYFILAEPDPYLEGKRYREWYEEHFYGGRLIGREEFGIITFEHWIKND